MDVKAITWRAHLSHIPASINVRPASSLWQALTTTTLVLVQVLLASKSDFKVLTSIE